VIIPSRFEVAVQGGITIAHDGTGVLIMAAPIEPTTDDTMELVRIHARRNGLVFDSVKTIFVGGVQRPLAMFHGKLKGVPFRHVVVPLIGPGYRIAVAFQAPLQRFTDDQLIEGEVFQLYTQRIVVP
jgi:hypothetical protein